jgi:hypothetical protein
VTCIDHRGLKPVLIFSRLTRPSKAHSSTVVRIAERIFVAFPESLKRCPETDREFLIPQGSDPAPESVLGTDFSHR